VLRVIREILFFSPKKRGTNIDEALNFLNRVTRHKAITVVVSDFIGQPTQPTGGAVSPARGAAGSFLTQSLAQHSYTALRQTNRRHDVIAIQVVDRYELELPAIGRLIFKDAETGEVVEINTNEARKREAFAERQAKNQNELMRLFRSANIDAIQLRTDRPYALELAKFFETRERRVRRG
jgi:hypothetical protein